MSRRSLRRYARRDGNEPSIVKTIKACGATWLPIAVRDGPDGVVGWHGFDYLIEIKTPTGKHKAGQETFSEKWGGTIHVVRTEADVLQLLQLPESATSVNAGATPSVKGATESAHRSSSLSASTARRRRA